MRSPPLLREIFRVNNSIRYGDFQLVQGASQNWEEAAFSVGEKKVTLTLSTLIVAALLLARQGEPVFLENFLAERDDLRNSIAAGQINLKNRRALVAFMRNAPTPPDKVILSTKITAIKAALHRVSPTHANQITSTNPAKHRMGARLGYRILLAP